jgi:hypothetical protein
MKKLLFIMLFLAGSCLWASADPAPKDTSKKDSSTMTPGAIKGKGANNATINSHSGSLAPNDGGASSISGTKNVNNTSPASGSGIALISLIGIFVICSGIIVFLLYITNKSDKDEQQALGLPSGSVRAIIAILLVVFFMLLAVIFYFDSDTNVHNTDLSKQIITILGTLVTAVSSFYFGSKAGEQAQSTLQNALQNQGAQGQQVKVTVSLDPSVTGPVEAAAAAALNSTQVQIVQSGTTNVIKGSHLATDPNGTFTFTGVLAGSYTLSGSLQVTPAGATANVTLTGTQTISIQSGTAPINLTIKQS